MLISVLIPVYGVEKFISQCANSLFSNTIANECEFIFLNDATPDKSLEILESVISNFPNLMNNIRIITHEKNRGLTAARNTLLENATGDYIICVDSDDWVEPTYLEDFKNAIEKSKADIISCNYVVEKNNGSRLKNYVFSDNCNQNFLNILSDRITAFVWNKLIKRQLFLENNIKWFEEYSMFEDLYIVSQLSYYAKSFYSIENYNYHYRFSSTSLSHINSEKKFYEMFYMLKTLKDKLVDMNVSSSAIDLIDYRITWVLLAYTKKYILSVKEIRQLFTSDSAYCNLKEISLFNKKDKLLYFFVKHKFFVLYKWAAILIMIKTKTKFSLIKESILLK